MPANRFSHYERQFSRARVPSSAVLDPPWTPFFLGDSLLAWYDAADAITVTEIGGAVSGWDDKSGNGYHLAQTSEGNKPEWGQGAQINGLNVMDYSSTFDQLFKDSIPDIDLTQFAHIGLVMGKTIGDWPAVGALFKTDNTDKLDHRYQSNSVDGQIKTVFTLDSVATSQSSPASTELREEVPFISAFWYDGDVIVTSVDGGLVSLQSNVADGGTFTINKIQVGRESNTPKNWQGELVILNTSDTQAIQDVEGYLAWKWSGAL